MIKRLINIKIFNNFQFTLNSDEIYFFDSKKLERYGGIMWSGDIVISIVYSRIEKERTE